jgi:hypothetical protein
MGLNTHLQFVELSTLTHVFCVIEKFDQPLPLSAFEAKRFPSDW